MRTWVGRLDRVDLGTGAWVLTLPDGRRLLLLGDIPVTLEGETVRVHGEAVDGASVAMVGDGAIMVASIEAD